MLRGILAYAVDFLKLLCAKGKASSRLLLFYILQKPHYHIINILLPGTGIINIIILIIATKYIYMYSFVSVDEDSCHTL